MIPIKSGTLVSKVIKGTTVVLRAFYLPIQLDRKLRRAATQANVTPSELIINILSSAIKDKEPRPGPRRSRFAKGDIVTFTHAGEVKRGQVVEVDVDDEPTARLTVWLQGIWVKVHPDHCVREQ